MEETKVITASEAAAALGRIKSEKKAAAVRENGKLGGGQMKPLASIPCNCEGEGLERRKTGNVKGAVHGGTCPEAPEYPVLLSRQGPLSPLGKYRPLSHR